MARLIGLDEAGLGPNLGPFVVAVTVWDVPGSPSKFDFWDSFADVLTNSPGPNDQRLHIADSKKVFQPKHGFAGLERGVFAALGLIGQSPQSFDELREVLRPTRSLPTPHQDVSPWYAATEMRLPTEPTDDHLISGWKKSCDRAGIKLVTLKAAVVEAAEFNDLLDQFDNKSLVVSRVAFQLLRSVWNPEDAETLVVGDKHGGRNRYDQLLSEVLDGEMIFRLAEGANLSEYKVGNTLLRFQPRAEEHGPVALASMIAKYVRELAMTRFNEFWTTRIEGLKPTQGYPTDAKRFRSEVAEMQQHLEISDHILWRNR